MWTEPKQVPCRYCGEPTEYQATRKCNNCWEVIRRLRRFLKTEKGREFAKIVLKQAESEAEGTGGIITARFFSASDEEA